MSILDFFKKKKNKKNKQSFDNVDKITLRDNYSTLSDIYRSSIYTLQEDTGTLFFDLVNFDEFWDKYISDHKKYIDRNDQSFVTIRVINESKKYVYPETLREKTELNKKSLKPIADSQEFKGFTRGLIEVGFWDFATGEFTPVWSAKYTA